MFQLWGLIIVALLVAQPSVVLAKKKRSKAQVGYVKVDVGSIFSAPDFDAPVIAQTGYKQRLIISRKAYPGRGGFGVFYKVKIAKGKYGYISEAEIFTKGPKPKSASGKKAGKENPLEPIDMDKGKDGKKKLEPLLFSKFLGISYGRLNYREMVNKVPRTTSMTTFGLKMAGPDLIANGPPMNVELSVSLDVPEFYDEFKTAPITGFLTTGHVAIPIYIPLDMENLVSMVWIGFMGAYSNYQIPAQTQIDSQELKIGLAALWSVSYRFSGKYILQGDWKYYYEKEAYSGATLSLGVQY